MSKYCLCAAKVAIGFGANSFGGGRDLNFDKIGIENLVLPIYCLNSHLIKWMFYVYEAM